MQTKAHPQPEIAPRWVERLASKKWTVLICRIECNELTRGQRVFNIYQTRLEISFLAFFVLEHPFFHYNGGNLVLHQFAGPSSGVELAFQHQPLRVFKFTALGAYAHRRGISFGHLSRRCTVLLDGKYLTVPIHGNPNATREVVVSCGSVRINQHTFSQDDFFKVNRLTDRSVDHTSPWGSAAECAIQQLKIQ